MPVPAPLRLQLLQRVVTLLQTRLLFRSRLLLQVGRFRLQAILARTPLTPRLQQWLQHHQQEAVQSPIQVQQLQYAQ